MNKPTLAGVLATGVLATTFLASSAFAQDDKTTKDDAALHSAKIHIAQAIEAAEAKSGGRAASVDFEVADQGGEPYYLIETIGTDGKEQKLSVNANTGDVTNAPADEKQGEGDEENDGD